VAQVRVAVQVRMAAQVRMGVRLCGGEVWIAAQVWVRRRWDRVAALWFGWRWRCMAGMPWRAMGCSGWFSW